MQRTHIKSQKCHIGTHFVKIRLKFLQKLSDASYVNVNPKKRLRSDLTLSHVQDNHEFRLKIMELLYKLEEFDLQLNGTQKPNKIP